METQIEQNQPKKKKRWVWWVIGIMLFFVLVGVFSDDEEKKPDSKAITEKDSQVEQAGVSEPKEEVVPEPSPIELSGTGQQASQKFTLENGLSVFKITHTGRSNFIVNLMDSDGQNIELLANEIGSFDGAKAVGIAKKGEYLLNISADGKWTAKIEQPRPEKAERKPQSFTGNGQQVSPFVQLDKGLSTFKLKHTGKSNYIVVLMDKKGNTQELLVNEIGDFDGSKAVGIAKTGLYLLNISADGEWSIAVE